jgi:hypothetical protein
MRSKQRTRLGQISRLNFLQLIVGTSRCKGNKHPTQATMQQMQLLTKVNIKWLNPPLVLWSTWKQPHPQQLTAAL